MSKMCSGSFLSNNLHNKKQKFFLGVPPGYAQNDDLWDFNLNEFGQKYLKKSFIFLLLWGNTGCLVGKRGSS